MTRETIKVYERNTLKKDETVQMLTKALEKQSEKMDLQRVMMEWKIDQLENSKEVGIIFFFCFFSSINIKIV